jgi:hypothetical protein
MIIATLIYYFLYMHPIQGWQSNRVICISRLYFHSHGEEFLLICFPMLKFKQLLALNALSVRFQAVTSSNPMMMIIIRSTKDRMGISLCFDLPSDNHLDFVLIL